MPDTEAIGAVKPYAYTQNRELSWLRFNHRVLEEAADESVPLLERLKFIAIFTSNLDEFFMVRVGSLFDLSQLSPEEIDNKTGWSPMEQLEQIYQVVPGLIEVKDRLYARVMAQLKEAGIRDLTVDQLAPEEKRYAEQYFKNRVHPMLSPQIVDAHHPFPRLQNKALYLAAYLRGKKETYSLGFVPIPSALPRFICLPNAPERFIRMENLIAHWVPALFGNYKAEQVCVLCATRNADISFDEEKFEDSSEDFRNRMSKLLKKRSSLSVVRLEIGGRIGGDFLKRLKSRIDLQDHQVYFDDAPLDMKYVYALVKQLPDSVAQPLSFQPYQPRWPEDLQQGGSVMEQIFQRDRLLFFPFDRVEPFLNLLSEAAERPDVLSIKITIYRLASTSKIARLLCRAAENGKDVTVLMELRARFDEANNISWSRLLEDAGCRVLYGLEGYKCHSKICLITLRDGERLRYITQIGTGNYNEKTNAMYTDLSLLTASESIGLDGTAFFQNMLIGNLEGEYSRLLVSPVGIKCALIDLIREEMEKGPEGYICLKANSMTEREIIDQLAEASSAGVQIQLILRGICCLLPGIPVRTENIHVTSIVGRYLEHARIYCFGKGDDAKVYLSSADMMTRNLNRRVEIACPVEDPELKRQLRWILNTQLEDNVKASSLLPDGSYCRKYNSLKPTDSQQVFMQVTLHNPYVPTNAKPPHGKGVLSRIRSGWAGLKRKFN